MSLDIKIMEKLSFYAETPIEDRIKDGMALTYINTLRFERCEEPLRSHYLKFYFKAKQHYKEVTE